MSVGEGDEYVAAPETGDTLSGIDKALSELIMPRIEADEVLEWRSLADVRLPLFPRGHWRRTICDCRL